MCQRCPDGVLACPNTQHPRDDSAASALLSLCNEPGQKAAPHFQPPTNPHQIPVQQTAYLNPNSGYQYGYQSYPPQSESSAMYRVSSTGTLQPPPVGMPPQHPTQPAPQQSMHSWYLHGAPDGHNAQQQYIPQPAMTKPMPTGPQHTFAGNPSDVPVLPSSITGGTPRHSLPSQTKPRIHQCSFCPKAFHEKGNLTTHERTVHLHQKLFVCPTCGKKYGQRGTLTIHQKTVHQKLKNYHCDLCDRSFGVKSHLSAHQKTVHLKRKDFVCQHCGKAFGRKYNLRTHERTVHQQKREYRCQYCEKTFGQKGTLTTHEKTVHLRERHHACPACPKWFGVRGDLKKHARKVHNLDLDTVRPSDVQRPAMNQSVPRGNVLVSPKVQSGAPAGTLGRIEPSLAPASHNHVLNPLSVHSLDNL